MASATSAEQRIPEMCEEDCSYVLRELELSAFAQLVAAFRAQGSFTKFKETVLEGVKTALFISDENYKAELRKAANDELLMKVASILNPSYDCFADWGTLALEVEEDCRVIPQPRHFEGSSTHAVADDLLQMATVHNENVEENDIAMAAILQMPKVPFVPERLRLLLRDSESLHTDRILPPKVVDDFVEPAPPTPTASDAKKTPKPTAVRRRRKAKVNGQKESSEISPDALSPEQKPSTSGATSGPPQLSPQKTSSEAQAAALLGLLPSSKDAETMGVKEFINKIQLQIEQEQRTAVNDAGQRRKRKPRQTAAQKEGYQECARCRPFVFPRHNGEGAKPQRGNPDRNNSAASRRNSNPSSAPQTPAPPSTSTTSPMAPPPLPPVPQTPAAQQPQITAPPPLSTVGPSSSAVDPVAMPAPLVTPKENAILAVRRLPSPSSASVPSVHLANVIAKASASAPTVLPPASASGIFKRARVASFTEASMSPSDVAQRAVLKTRASFLPATPVAKLKVAVPTDPQSPGAPPTTPSRTFYATGLSVATVNRIPVPMRSSSVGSTPPSVVGGPSTSGGGGGGLLTGAQGEVIDFGVTPRPMFKRNVYKTPSVPSVRLSNGTTVITSKSTPPHNLGGSSSPVTVLMKKATPPPTMQGAPISTTSPSPAGFVVHRPSPPPAAFGTASTSTPVQIMRKFVATNSLPPNSPNQQMSVGQFLRKSSSATSSPTAVSDPSTGPPPPKRLIYCEPSSSNAVITTTVEAYDLPLTTSTDFQPTGAFETKYGNAATKEFPGNNALAEFGLEYIGDMRPTSPSGNDATTGPPIAGMNHGYEAMPRTVYRIPAPSEALHDLQKQPTLFQQHLPYPSSTTTSSEKPTYVPPPVEETRKPPVPDILQQSMMEIS